MLANNIVLMRTKSVNERIGTFLHEQTPVTKRNYFSDIKQFFKVMRDITLTISKEGVVSSTPALTEEHLKFEGEHIRQYKQFLKKTYVRENPLTKKLEPVGATVERKMQSVKALYKHLSADLKFIRMEVFNIKSVKIKSQKTSPLTFSEYETMVELANEYEDRGSETSVCIALLGRTGIREEAILTIAPQNLININGYWVVQVEDKGEVEDRKTIPHDLYDRLEKLRKGDHDKYFTISASTLLRRVTELGEKMGLAKKITPHSLKKMGINDIIRRTKNMDLAQQHGNHKNRKTTEIYKEDDFDPSQSPSLIIGQELDLCRLDGYSKEELINLIKKCNLSTQFEIIQLTTKL